METIKLSKKQKEETNDLHDKVNGYKEGAADLSAKALSTGKMLWGKIYAWFPDLDRKKRWTYDSVEGTVSEIPPSDTDTYSE